MTAQPIIGVVGLGTMGLGIAQVYAAAGFQVMATDAQPAAHDNALQRLSGGLSPRVTAGKMTAEDLAALLARVTIVDSPLAMAPAALVIEAIIENPAAKQALFHDLETVLDRSAVLATNTSSIPVTTVAHGLAHPERVLGLHFFNPAPAMKLVELIGHNTTAPAALTVARLITEAAGKTVIQCPDRPGFIVNRCARPYYGEALAMLDEGRSAAEIDAAMQAAGYRLGPFALIDLIGADINLAATTSIYDAMGQNPRFLPFPALKAQVVSGNLGRKTGQGFIYPNQPGPVPADAAAILQRIEATLINEAAWLLSEGGTTPDGIDTALQLGLNFPRGPFAALLSYGKPRILATLAALAANAPPPLKTRYQPAPVLEQP